MHPIQVITFRLSQKATKMSFQKVHQNNSLCSLTGLICADVEGSAEGHSTGIEAQPPDALTLKKAHSKQNRNVSCSQPPPPWLHPGPTCPPGLRPTAATLFSFNSRVWRAGPRYPILTRESQVKGSPAPVVFHLTDSHYSRILAGDLASPGYRLNVFLTQRGHPAIGVASLGVWPMGRGAEPAVSGSRFQARPSWPGATRRVFRLPLSSGQV